MEADESCGDSCIRRAAPRRECRGHRDRLDLGVLYSGARASDRRSSVSRPVSPVAWNEAASQDLEHELHRLHEIWNSGDIASLKKYIIGDPVLPTFELDPLTHEAIKLSSKSELDAFVATTISAQGDRNLKTRLAEPITRCRATATWGVCTEECTVSYLRIDTDETVAVDHLRSTQIAVKTADGWQWIQWQMSDSSRRNQ